MEELSDPLTSLVRKFFRAGEPFRTELIRLDPKHLADAHAEFVGLHDRVHDAGQFRLPDALRHFLQGGLARLAELNLVVYN